MGLVGQERICQGKEECNETSNVWQDKGEWKSAQEDMKGKRRCVMKGWVRMAGTPITNWSYCDYFHFAWLTIRFAIWSCLWLQVSLLTTASFSDLPLAWGRRGPGATWGHTSAQGGHRGTMGHGGGDRGTRRKGQGARRDHGYKGNGGTRER